MAKTEVSGKQLKDGSVELVDLASEVSDVLNTLQSDVATLQTDVAAKADAGNLASVATSGSYTDLSDSHQYLVLLVLQVRHMLILL